MIKTDELGDYNDEEIPEGCSFPLTIDPENTSVNFADNTILMRYAGATIETSVLLQEKRKAEFVTRLANGDMIVLKDKAGNDRVFRRVKRSIGKNGNILCEFEEIRKAVEAGV